MLVASVSEKCIKTLFFNTGVANLQANFWAVKHMTKRQIMFLKSEKTIVLEIMKFCGFWFNITVLEGMI